jgi:hypothetical protein
MEKSKKMNNKEIVQRAYTHLELSWFNKGMKKWYKKTYTEGEWTTAIKRAAKLQGLVVHQPHLSKDEIFYMSHNSMLKAGVKPTHLAIVYVLAGEPFSKLYFQNIGKPGFLNDEGWRTILNYYTKTDLVIDKTCHTDWYKELSSI